MIKNKKHWEVSEREIREFFNSLDKERETFKLSSSDILNSEIIIKKEIDGKIAGIAGIRKHKMLPVLFILVKSEFKGKGAGKILMERLHDIVKKRYSFIVLSVIKENKRAIDLFKKFRYRVFGKKEEFFYMINTFNNRGKITSKVLMLIYKIKENLLPIFLFVFIFLFVSFYTFNANIHGDGANNAFLAKEIAKSQNLLQYQPYRIAEIVNGEIVYYPIHYSQFSHVFMTLFYLIGGEIGFKLFSPFLSAINISFAYILLRDINKVVAVLACIIITIIDSFRFISMTPLMEQYLLPVAIASICSYSLFLKRRKYQYPILTGLFLGISSAIKQQGILFVGIVLFIVFLVHLYDLINRKNKSGLKVYGIILFIFIIISVIPIFEQIERNGTVDYVPANTVRIPFLYPKYFTNQNAVDTMAEWLSPSYWFIYESLSQALKAFLLYPVYYYNVSAFPNIAWLIFLSVLYLLGIIFITMKNKPIGLILLSVYLLEVCTLYIMNTPIQKYHVIGLAILSIFLSSGIYYFYKLIANKKILVFIVSLVLVVSLMSSYVICIHQLLFGNSGRIDNEHLKSLENLSLFVETNVHEDTIILGPDGVYRYWIERNFIWMSDMGGTKIPKLLTTRDEETAIKILKGYDISYIFVDNDQIKRRGLGDYIPPDGLLSYIDKSQYFKKIYDDKVLRLYEVKYPIFLEYNNIGS